jgi:hypothetical protein
MGTRITWVLPSYIHTRDAARTSLCSRCYHLRHRRKSGEPALPRIESSLSLAMASHRGCGHVQQPMVVLVSGSSPYLSWWTRLRTRCRFPRKSLGCVASSNSRTSTPSGSNRSSSGFLHEGSIELDSVAASRVGLCCLDGLFFYKSWADRSLQPGWPITWAAGTTYHGCFCI